MRSPRDLSTIWFLPRQLCLSNVLLSAYMDVHKNPYSYLVVDMSPTCENRYRIRTNFMPGEDTIIYEA